MVIDTKSNFGVKISKQGIEERFNDGAVTYVQNLLGEYLSEQIRCSLDTDWLDLFNRVVIKDSTKFDVPEELQEKLPGFGGSASKAGCCIQYEFDIKGGQVNDINITPANRPDSRDAAETTALVREGDLTIRDLGYFRLKYFKTIEEDGAYFLSRLNTNTLVYQKTDDKYVELDFGKLYQTMKASHLLISDIQVYIGKEEKFPVRLIIELCPEEVFNKRIRKVNAYNKKKGHKTSENCKNRAKLSLYITNIPADKIEGGVISKIYKIRWQIELTFKTWKSTFNLAKVKKMKYERLMCLLNIRLLLIMINWELFSMERTIQFKKTGNLLSAAKCFNTLKDNIEKLRRPLLNNCKGLRKWIRWMKSAFESSHWLESKKNKMGLEEILYLKIL